MQSILVTEPASGPQLVTVDRPQISQEDSQTQIKVTAAGLHNVVRSRAGGTHYTAAELPLMPGVDGTGIDTATDQAVFFVNLDGSFTEYINISKRAVFPIPAEVDPVVAASLVNAVTSSWMALKYRVDFLQNGKPGREWTCFINGVTTMSGRMAIRVARAFGATKVYGASRNETAMAALEGLDERIVLNEANPKATDFGDAAKADVVLDYLYGDWPRVFLVNSTKAGNKTPITYVSIGSLAGEGCEIPAKLLRVRDLTVRGAGVGSWPMKKYGDEVPGMLDILKGVKLGEDDLKQFKLSEIADAWSWKGKQRAVMVM